LQFFLALLLNITERPAILSLIEQRYPSRDPYSNRDLVRELSELGVLEFASLSLALMLQCLLTKRSDCEIQKAFTDRYSTERLPDIKSGLGEVSAGLQNSWLLEPVSRTKGRSSVVSCIKAYLKLIHFDLYLARGNFAHCTTSSKISVGEKARLPKLSNESVQRWTWLVSVLERSALLQRSATARVF